MLLALHLSRLESLRTTHPHLYASLVENTVLDHGTRTVDPRVLNQWKPWAWKDGDKTEWEEAGAIAAPTIEAGALTDSKNSQTSRSTEDDFVAIAPAPSLPRSSTALPSGTCPICLDTYHPTSLLRRLPCAHSYHQTCIDEWLTTKRGVCPVCRTDYTAGGEWFAREYPQGLPPTETTAREDVPWYSVAAEVMTGGLLGRTREQRREQEHGDFEMTERAAGREVGGGSGFFFASGENVVDGTSAEGSILVTPAPAVLVTISPVDRVNPRSETARDQDEIAPLQPDIASTDGPSSTHELHPESSTTQHSLTPSPSVSARTSTSSTPRPPPPLPNAATISNPDRLIYLLHRRILRERARRSTLGGMFPGVEEEVDREILRELDDWDREARRMGATVRSPLTAAAGEDVDRSGRLILGFRF
ncbi:hypothetical protein HDU93_000331 [Gonapodya sp. JEL0774]|nr:hypothetical protein HDU93_000331 [Gonapodya sp. JEL0774]